MLIQFFSDIHLEFGPVEIPDTPADVIVAAGDIGLGVQGLEWLKTLPKPVVYVAGNHEYYGDDQKDVLLRLRINAKGSNVHFLEQDEVEIGDVRFLGCTLWTSLGQTENELRTELARVVSDFRKIRIGEESLSVERYIELHENASRWLISQLEQPHAGKTVVVTHHAPTPWSWKDTGTSVKRYAYCNDLKELLHTYEIDAWIHGHTHWVSDYRCAGARIVCNPRGYAPDRLVEGFDGDRLLYL